MATFTFNPETDTGEIYANDATYATSRSGAGTLTKRTAYSLVGQYLFSGQYYVHETFLSFDTSSIAGYTISSVTLSIYSINDFSTQDFTVNARAVNWGATLETADFIAGASLSGNPLRASLATSGLVNAAYNDFTSDGSFVSNVASPVRLVLSSSRTESGTTPTTDEYWQTEALGSAGGTHPPKLTVVATPPPATPPIALPNSRVKQSAVNRAATR